MLSILIPVYNYDIIPLVEKLSDELAIMDIPFEVICLDDASDNKKIQNLNKKINEFKNCFYEILPTNIGRSSMRNSLAEKAKYNSFIFLDADVLPTHQKFIKTYIKALETKDVIFGGISYPLNSISLKDLLHYRYGKEREAKSYKKRESTDKKNFTSANFAIKKEVFEKVRFNETIKTYGFEDLLFSKDLISKGYEIEQIDNAVVHNGIVKNNHDFILKEQESLKTLSKLYKNKDLNINDVKLLYYHSFLKRTSANNLYIRFFILIKRTLLKNLTSKSPSLFLFDLYRLGYFSSLKN